MRYKRTFLVCALFLLFVASLALNFLQSNQASAQDTPFSVIFVDKTSITYNGKTFTDVNPYDETYNYKLDGKQNDCIDQIEISNFGGSPRAVYHRQTQGTSGDDCDKRELNVAIDPTTLPNRHITGYRLADDTIWLPIGGKDPGCGVNTGDHNYVSGHPSHYKNAPKQVEGGRDNPSFEKTRYDQVGGEGDVDIWIRMSDNGNGELNIGEGCSSSKTFPIKLANNGATTVPPEGTYGAVTTTPPAGGGPGADAGDIEGSSCEDTGGVLNWFICPVIELLDSATNWLDSQIESLLVTPNPSDAGKPLQTAWGNIRNIALILLVPIMLVMVISTAIGANWVDAYTVRKAMPRFAIAVIAISLSWYICDFLISLTNDVGRGVLGLLTAPFGGPSASLADLVSSVEGGVLSWGGLVIFGGLIGAGLISFGIVLSFAFIIVLALLTGFVVLTLRQLFIIVLVVFAPLAIVAWIFPNTERLWKLWWSNFSKLLLMFPLIMALIASGKIFASIVAGANIYSGVDEYLKQLMIIVAYVAPYFFIPATFKMGGQLFGSLAGAVVNSTSGIRQQQQKYRAGQRQHGLEKLRSGNRFAGGTDSNFRGRLNRGLQGAALVATGAAGYNAARWGSRVRGQRAALEGNEAMELLEKNADIAAIKADDHLAEAVQLDGNRAEVEKRLLDTGRYGQAGSRELSAAVESVMRAKRAGSATAVKSAMAIARAQSGTGYETSADMYESIIQASDGDLALQNRLLAVTKSASEQARRPDLGTAGFVDQAEGLTALRNGASKESVNQQLRTAAFRTGNIHQILSGRSAGVDPLITQVGSDFEAAVQRGDLEAAMEHGSQIVSMRQAMSSASPEVRASITKMLEGVRLDPSAVNPDTGQPYSIDEQLGVVIQEGIQLRGGTTAVAGKTAQEITQDIRTRSGAYDAGGANLTPEQIELRRQQQAQLPGNPDQENQ